MRVLQSAKFPLSASSTATETTTLDSSSSNSGATELRSTPTMELFVSYCSGNGQLMVRNLWITPPSRSILSLE
jgi:hypothetical protein